MEQENVDIDTMLYHVGDFGRCQWLLMFLFSAINILSAFHYFGQTFISVIPDYQCANVDSQCSYTILTNNIPEEVACTSWVYNNTENYNYGSIIQEMNWVCSDSWKPAFGQSMFFVGSVIGTLIFGVLADRFGRLHVLVLANMFALVGNFTTIFSNNWYVFGTLRFIAGCASDSNFVMMYIIVMEYLRPKMRTFGLNICIGVFYCLGCMVIPWIGVAAGNWKNLLLVISLPHILVLSFYFIVPESAQWLISKGRIKDAIRRFKWIARINNKEVNEKHFDNLKQYYSSKIIERNSKESFVGLLKTPKLRKKTLILIFKSMVMTLCYDAISRNVNGFGYSPFVVFTITSSILFPSCLFILGVQDKIGRKALASGAFLLSGLFTAASGIIQFMLENPDPTIILILAIVGRLGITIAYNSGHQYAVELIPTVVRGQGVSVIHVFGYVASFFSPYVLYLGNFWKPCPEIVLGILLVLGAITCLFLPETLNRTLPVTLEDGEEFGENEGVLEFACCGKFTESTTELTRDVMT